MSSKKEEAKPYLVIRDTREQQGWTFTKKEPCLGTIDGTLKTGDYTLQGYEDSFVIERKGTPAEFAGNLVQKRFERELERLEAFQHAFIVCEFEVEQVCIFPQDSGVPEHRKKYLRVTPQFFMKRIHDIQLKYKTRVVFVGSRGREYCSSLFKRITEHVEPKSQAS